VAQVRTATATTLVVADGIGSGIRACVAATMCTSRLLALFESGFSVRRAASSLIRTMESAKSSGLPYAAFSIARILNHGEASVLTYEAPGAVLVSRRQATPLPRRPLVLEDVVAEEANCHLEPGEGLMLFSDGITQAGLGGKLRGGWRLEGAAEYISDLLARGATLNELPERVAAQANLLSQGTVGDDATAVLASCRWGRVVNILTGPPADRRKDHEVAHRFMAMAGAKLICGATTADVVARHLGREITVDRSSQSLLAPPSYLLEGVDLVTEGAVTLNQLYNVLDADPTTFDEDSSVTQLHALVSDADRTNIFLGGARNPASKHISFQQRGIMPRDRVISLVADKLREAGKLVVVEAV
jgi:hypothetical protein